MSVTKTTSEVNMITSNLLHDIRKIISLDNYIVLIYLVSLNKIGAISISETLPNDDIEKGLLAQLRNSEFIKNVNPLFIDVFHSVINKLSYNELNSLLYVLKDFSIDDHLFSDFFEDLIYKISLSQGRIASEYLQPLELTHFIKGLISKDEGQKIYNPFAGIASFGVIANEKDSYYGQELVPTSWGIGLLRLIINGKDHQNYVCDDSVSNWLGTSQKFDVIVANPPLNVRLNERIEGLRFLEDFYISKGLDALADNGYLISVSSFTLLTSTMYRPLIQKLVDNDYLEAIVSFPSNILLNASIPFYVLILNKNKAEKGVVKFFDAKDFSIKSNKIFKIDDSNLLEAFKNSKDRNVVRKITNEQIKEEDYNLQVGRYFIDIDFNLDHPSKLGNILTPVSLVNDRNISRFYKLSLNNLSDNILKKDIDNSTLEIVNDHDAPRFMNILGRNALIISTVNNIKIGFFKFDGTPVLLPRDFYAVTFDDDLIDANYLVSVLLSTNVLEQYKKYSKGNVLSRISRNDFFKIIVSLPPLDTQHAIYLDNLRDYIGKNEELNHLIKVQNLLDSSDSNSLLRHEIAGPLRNIKSSLNFILSMMEKKISSDFPEVLHLTPHPAVETTFKEYLNFMKRDLDRISVSVNKMSGEIDFSQMKIEEIDLISFIQDYVNSVKVRANNKFSIELDFNEIELKLNGIDQLLINGDKNLLSNVFDNLIENAEKHAFSSEDFEDNKIKIELLCSFEDNTVQIDICNTGKLLPSDLTYNQLVRKGGSFGINNGSGIGMWYVSEVLKKHKGFLGFTDETGPEGIDSEFVTSIELTLPVIFKK